MRHTMEVKNNREILFLESPFITLMVEEFTSLILVATFPVIYWSVCSSSSKGGNGGGDSGSFHFIGEL